MAAILSRDRWVKKLLFFQNVFLFYNIVLFYCNISVWLVQNNEDLVNTVDTDGQVL